MTKSSRTIQRIFLRIKTLSLTICLILMITLSSAFSFASAVDELPETSDTPDTIQTSEGLRIDTEKTYSGMTTSYAQGYIPSIRNGQAIIVLPLLGDAKDNVISVTPDISTDGPFVYANYHFDVRKSNGVFLVRLEVPLKSDRVNGTYPVSFSVEYTGTYGEPMTQIFTVYVTISDGKTNDPQAPELFISGYSSRPVREQTQAPVTTETTEEPTTAPTTEPTTPPLRDPNDITGGDTFKVTVSIRNLGNTTARNIKLTYSGDGEVTPVEDINTMLVDNIAAGKTRDVEFAMQASPNAMAGKHSMMVFIEYSDEQGGQYSVNRDISVDIYQPVEVEFDRVDMPGAIESGDSTTLPIGILNVGKSSIYDVTCKLNVKGLRGASVYIDEVYPGSNSVAEMSVFVGTLESSDQHYGYTAGQLVISYKDADGEEYTYTTTISTEILEPSAQTNATPEDEEPTQTQGTSQWIMSVVLGVAVIAIAVAVAIVVRYYRLTRIGK